MIRLRRKLFLRALSRYGSLTEQQLEQVRVALDDAGKVKRLELYMHRRGALRLERLQALGRWIIENWSTIAKVLGIVIMFLDTPDEPEQPKEPIRSKTPGHEFSKLQSVVRASRPNASPVQGKGKV